jgi:FMN phosphatase YigB (HAD superfamily)
VGRVDCRPFLATALARLGADADGTVMADDDIETDVLAAQRQGLSGVLVKTSRYLPAHQAASSTPAMSWIPSPTYPPHWANCHERREPPGTGPGIMRALRHGDDHWRVLS